MIVTTPKFNRKRSVKTTKAIERKCLQGINTKERECFQMAKGICFIIVCIALGKH